MAFSRRLHELDQNVFEWTHDVPDDCPRDSDLEENTVVSLCDSADDPVDEQTIHIWFPVDPGEPPDTDIRWNVYAHPFAHFLDTDADEVILQPSHPHDYGDLILGLIDAGYVDDTDPHASQVLRTLTQNLQEMINVARVRGNLPIIQLGYVPPYWESGLRLPGGHVIRHLHHLYYTRYPLSAELNTVSPVQDVHRTRFRDFNGGPMVLPASADDHVINRDFTSSLSRINGDRVHINLDDNVMYILPGTDISLTQLRQIKTRSFFYFDRISSGETARCIAKTTTMLDWEVPWDNSQTARLIGFDPQWLQGTFADDDELRLGFEVSV